MAATESQLDSMDAAELDRRLQKAYNILADAGSHYVIDSVADLEPVIEDIERRMANGVQP